MVPVAACILAAGLGRRLGHRPKAALRIGGVSVLQRLIGALQAAGVSPVSVVVGAYPEVLLPLVAQAEAHALVRQQAETTLIDSQRLALAQHLERCPGHDLLLVLADLPRLASTDIQVLLQAWQSRPAMVQAQMPVVAGVRGHPLLLSAAAVAQILATPAGLGIRDWLSAHPQQLRPLASTRRAYTADLDTPEDLAALKADLAPEPVDWPEP